MSESDRFIEELRAAAPHFVWALREMQDKRKQIEARPVVDTPRLCCPITAVYLHKTDRFLYSFAALHAAACMGYSEQFGGAVMNAADDLRAHDGNLRRRMLEAVGLR